MTLQEIMRAISQLSSDDLDQLTEFMDRQRKSQGHEPMSEAELGAMIDTILQTAEPSEVVAGTMDVDELMRGIDAIREGHSQAELDAIAAAMNEEYVEPDETGNG